MREAALLKLDCVQVSHNLTKEATNCQVLHQLVFLEMKHPGYNIWSILSFLTVQEMTGNLRPFGVCRHSNEEIGLVILPDYCHGILKFGIHVPRSSCE